MEARTITVVSTRQQINVELSTSAETVGELKRDLAAQNIDYSDMTFYEGLTHSALIGDDALLPKDVVYKGEPTNHIVIMLTNTTKKIKSGALSVERAMLYDSIVNHSLEARCVEMYGKNYTRCSNDELMEVVRTLNAPAVAPEVEENEVELNAVEVATVQLLTALVDANCVSLDNITSAIEAIKGAAYSPKYSAEEIAEMQKFIEE